MRAVQFREYGGPEVLEVAQIDAPSPGPGSVRIAVRASSLAPGDMLIRSGARREVLPARFPFRTGFDAAGVVDLIGSGVSGVQPGQSVYGYSSPERRGTNADSAVLTAWAALPEGWSFEEGAAAAGSIETATRVLDRLAVGPGDVLLVQGASGAVGSLAVQLAVLRGARVLGTAGRDNLALVRTLGASATTYGDGLPARIMELAPEGVHAVFDTVGGTLPELVEIAGGPGRVVTIADTGAAAHGVHMSHGAPAAQAAAMGIPADPPAPHGLALPGTLRAEQQLRVQVAATFPLGEVIAAAQLLEQRHRPGKVVLVN